MRPVVDLTARNQIIIKDDETIPESRMILNSLGRARYRSKIDLSDAYFQKRVNSRMLIRTVSNHHLDVLLAK